MAQVAITPEQQAQLQSEVQQELERREWAEPDDNVMAEYITVLLANGSTKERVQTEMDDLVGSDFDPRFLDWLFDAASSLTSSSRRSPSPPARSPSIPSHPSTADRDTRAGGSRILNSALAPLAHPEKRKFDDRHDGQNKRRVSDGIPSGPRGMSSEGRSLAERLGPNRVQPGGGRGGLQVRGLAGGPLRQNGPGMGGQRGGFQGQGFRQQPGMMQPGFGGFFPPGQQEMMAQMMMMQANMAQMGEMMQQMVHEKETLQAQPVQTSVRPPRPPQPAKIPHGTKLGSHSVSAVPPKQSATPGPIPDKPSSKALCRYSVGCSNARCQYSHPSPVADEKTGMVLSEEPCEEGKKCKDAECTKSHVSPAAVLGETAGPSRMLCKYQNCTNPSCAFRHEDENGNPIPPPALTAAKAAKAQPKKIAPTTVEANPAMSDGEDGDVEVVMSSKSLMDGPLGDGKTEKACRYAERCTRPDCKFTHPASRPNPKSGKPEFRKTTLNGNGVGGGGGMNMSKKFGTAPGAGEKKLNPAVGEFKPAPAAAEVKGE